MKRNDFLKLIAIVTMFIDHLGVMFFPEMNILRIIGRISFPIFAFMIASGYKHTSSKKHYVKRLAIFAVISYLPYVYFNTQLKPNFLYINVLFLFLFSIGALYIYDLAKEKNNFVLKIILGVYIFLPIVYELAVPHSMFSYSTYGVLMVLLFYVFEKPLSVFLAYLALSVFQNTVLIPISYYSIIDDYQDLIILLFRGNPQQISIIALPFIQILSQFEFKSSINKYAAYIFYPLHMTIFIIIKMIL